MADSVETSKRVVVAKEQLWQGDVRPSETLEMKRQVFLEAGCEVSGSVFGDEIRVEGPVHVHKAVYATHSVEVFADGLVRFDSTLGAREAVLVHPRSALTVIQGNVVARQIRLCNCIVYGAVLGDELFLENTRCLGVVRGDRLVELRRSLVLTASGARVVFADGCGLLLPYAEASHGFEISGPISYLGADQGDSALTQEDVVLSPSGRHYLTAGRRMTDLVRLKRELSNVGNLLLQLTMRNSIQRAQKNNASLMYERNLLPKPIQDLANLSPEGELPSKHAT